MQTSVVNIKKERCDIYIGRSFGKYRNVGWGNPYSIQEYGRAGAIEKYEQYIRNNPEMMQRLPELKGKALGCWCAPSYCHGHVLQKLLKEIYPDE